MRSVLYPGSFDPVTNGHLDVAKRASLIFDKVLVAVAVNGEKTPLFTLEERAELLRESCRDIPNIEIVSFQGLLVDAITHFNAQAVIRGIRAVSDFEYEFQMALMNRELNSKCETLFMMPSPEYSYVSSSAVKELASFGGDYKDMLPEAAYRAMQIKEDETKVEDR